MGPLKGLKVVELAGIGPGPMCAMLLADLGADVLRIDRFKTLYRAAPRFELLNRSKRSIAVDLKKAEGVETVLRLVEQADALVEGFRPGVAERLGLGPDVCLTRNPRLVYGRMTGWGQSGPVAQMAGHDINYIALTGALHAIGTTETPIAPLNMIGDFGGGALYLAFGLVCALLEAKGSGKGQVIDAAMTDGSANLMTMIYALMASGYWTDARASNVVDGGAPFYGVYETSDGRFVALGTIEPQFYEELIERLGLGGESLPDRMKSENWPVLRARFEAVFRTRTRDAWTAVFEGSDACLAPVLSLAEAPDHPHNRARNTFVTHNGIVQPAPAPRFSRTPGGITRRPPDPGEHTREALADWGFAAGEIDALLADGAVTEKAETGFR